MKYPFLFLLLLIVSCKSVLDKKYNPETFQEDAQEIRASNKLTEEDAELLANYLLVARLNGASLEDMSYQQILDQAKQMKAADAAVEKINTDAEEKVKRLQNLLAVHVSGKKLSDNNGTKNIDLELRIENNSRKQISRFTGILTFTDQQNVEVRTVVLDVNQVLQAGTTKIIEPVPYSEIMEMDNTFLNTPFDKLKYTWVTDKILYTDGTIKD